MSDAPAPLDEILRTLQERAKELDCLYRVEEILRAPDLPLPAMLQAVAEALPPAWLHPAFCEARVTLREIEVQTRSFRETPWVLAAPIVVRGEQVGEVSVAYTQPAPPADEGPFLKEERKLLATVAERVGQTLLHQELTLLFGQSQTMVGVAAEKQDWKVILDVLARTDQTLFRQITRKMINHLSYRGVEEATRLLQRLSGPASEADSLDENRPLPRGTESGGFEGLSGATFEIAERHLGERELVGCLQLWIKEDRVRFLLQALESAESSVGDIASALHRFKHTGVKTSELSQATQTGLKVALIRRLLSDHLDFINTCRRYVDVEDFLDLASHTILLPKSHGKLGGKSAGLFLACNVIRRSAAQAATPGMLRTPRTWYLPSDGLLEFIAYNNLDEVYNWKYHDIDQIRQEYPNILQVFKSSRFPPETVQSLSIALESFGDFPLIVRSSSLLEDRLGSAFSGKYKSLFLANQGSRQDRLASLLDAIAEVYASVFSPDPIQYRAERGLLHFQEEMGIMIQEVVGKRVGRFFLPAYSGVAFSHTELRWSPRIRREDGLLRLVPGLGTRAVDRLADDYPVLVAPGQPSLRVNVTPEEIYRYSPKKIDVINLESNSFETVDRHTLLKELGEDFPGLSDLVSVFDGEVVRPARRFGLDFEQDNVIFTFEGLLEKTPFVKQIHSLLKLLQEAEGTPVDIEFACDGQTFYILQCRPQSHSKASAPAPIPRDLPPGRVLFSARRYVPNGAIPDLTHVVYVDPDEYAALPDLQSLRDVGRAVGQIDKLLPKRRFILMGPGRWGSRGDVKLGVSVTYSDISNTAMLVEIARKRGGYVPDPSFGTHFFQDLVEAMIRYLPLYPDDEGVIFNEAFFKGSENLLPQLLPKYADLAKVLRVIDVAKAASGQVLHVLMNGDLDEAVAVLGPPGSVANDSHPIPGQVARPSDDHWRWRLGVAERLGRDLDPERFGVAGLYVFGSTKNSSAGPRSDLDLLVHFVGTPEQRRELQLWLEGWSCSLAEMNYLRTGYRAQGLLDVVFVTDEEVASRSGYAAKIGAVTDAARPLPLGTRGS